MRTKISILSYILLFFLNPIELTRPHKDAAVHPPPIQLHARLHVQHYGGFFLSPGLVQGFLYVGIGKEMNQEYIIGVIIRGYLCALMAPRADLNHNLGKVKVRIDGNTANVIVPISNEDPLNNLFNQAFGPQNIRAAHICE